MKLSRYEIAKQLCSYRIFIKKKKSLIKLMIFLFEYRVLYNNAANWFNSNGRDSALKNNAFDIILLI